MKRYWLFEFDQYYPNGGMMDFVGDYDTAEEANAARRIQFNVDVSFLDVKTEKEAHNRWIGHHILDTHERLIIKGWDPYTKQKLEDNSMLSKLADSSQQPS